MHHFFEAEVRTWFSVTDEDYPSALHLQKNANLPPVVGQVFLRPGLCRQLFFFQLKRKRGYLVPLKNMGCLKLTYYPEPTLFLEEQAERTEAFTWRVWSRKERGFLGVDVEEQSQGDPPGWFARNFKDISDSRYPGIKIYETSLIADGSAVTLPGFAILVHPSYAGVDRTKVLQHEYGHFLDYMFSADLKPLPPVNYTPSIVNFYLMIGVPSLFNAATGIGGDHGSYWTEIRANQWAELWFGDSYIRDERNYPTKGK